MLYMYTYTVVFDTQTRDKTTFVGTHEHNELVYVYTLGNLNKCTSHAYMLIMCIYVCVCVCVCV